MKFLIPAAAVLVTFAGPSFANDLEACFDYSGTHSEMVEICGRATLEPDLSNEDRAVVYWYLGYAQNQEGLFDVAEENLLRSIEISPENSGSHRDLAWMYWEIDLYEEALIHFERAFELEPTADDLSGIGSSLSLLGREEDRAIEALEASLVLDPDYTWAARELGWAFIRFDRNPDAIDVFLRVLETSPDDQWAKLGHGVALSSNDEFDEARKVLQDIIAVEPENTRALVELAYIERQTDNLDEALLYAEHAFEIDPNYDNSIVQLSFALLENGDEARAKEIILQGYSGQPYNSYVVQSTLEFLNDVEDHKAGENILKAAIEQGIQRLSIYQEGTYLLLQLDQNEEVIELAQAGQTLFPSDWILPFNQSYAHLYLGQNDLALEALTKAKERGMPQEDQNDFATDAIFEGQMGLGLKARSL